MYLVFFNKIKWQNIAFLSTNSAINLRTDLIENEVHPSHESPFQEEHGFEPSEGMGSNTYSSVGGSIDTKEALASGTPTSAGTAAEGFRKAGLL
jgi:hypothetical protein